MAARIRIAVAVAILLALAAHPFEHPTVKECPCTHAIGTLELDRSESIVLEVLADQVAAIPSQIVEVPAISILPSRAPPVA